MKLYLICGEDSGDMHAANLIAAMRTLHPDLEVRGVGGDRLIAQGMQTVAHVRDINFMGFAEVVRNLGTIRGLFRIVEDDLRSYQPDVVILIDYPGFNLRIAPFVKKLGIPVFYYILPQLWAWKKGRIKIIKKYVDNLFVILPFEKEFYANEGLAVDFPGHPLLDAIGDLAAGEREQDLIALLPGSRTQEIDKMLPVMLEVAARHPELRFEIAGAPSRPASAYAPYLEHYPGKNVTLVHGQTYPLLLRSRAALVKSGTSTLETALLGTPEVVCYKGGWVSYQIAKRLVNISYISLVNLILDRAAVTELVQTTFTADLLDAELQKLLDPAHAQQILDSYAELRHKLGDAGASRRCAEAMLRVIDAKKP